MKNSPGRGQRHAHFHFHIPADLLTQSDFHWHLHVEPPVAPIPQVTDASTAGAAPYLGKVPAFAADGDLIPFYVGGPSSGAKWKVRPDTSGGNAGCICAYGKDTPGGNAPSAVLAHIYTSPPGLSALTPDPAAVCAFVDVYTGNWFFTHDKTPPATCAGTGSSPGRLGSEIPGAQCSATGADNYLVIWVMQNGSVSTIYPVYFKGITATCTNCQSSGSSGAAPISFLSTDDVPAPLPTSFLLSLQPATVPCGPCAESTRTAPVRIQYCEALQDGISPVWSSACGEWNMTVSRQSKAVSAVIRAANFNLCGNLCTVAWTGMIVPGRKQHHFVPCECAAGLDCCPCLVIEAV